MREGAALCPPTFKRFRTRRSAAHAPRGVLALSNTSKASGVKLACSDKINDMVVDANASSLLSLYIADMRYQSVALLTCQEEQELAYLAKEGDTQAFDHLVRANLRLVVNLARHYAQARCIGLPMVELISEGNLGLIAAARRFDPSRKVHFSTYATPWIKQAIRHGAEKWGDWEQLGGAWPAGRTRHRGEVPWRTEDIPLRSVRADATSERDDADPLDLLQDQGTPPDEDAERAILAAQLQSITDTALTPRERTLIRHKYGLVRGDGCSLSEAGEKMGVSRQRAHQIEVGALEKLCRFPGVEHLRGT
jgi:RNA polymerase primary sigma factor